MKGTKRESKRLQKKQRIKSEEEDRISLLPDDILVDIITRLPETQEAVRTGTLCKRWQHLWHKVPNLVFIFNVNYSSSKIAKFFLFVEKTLNQRGQSNIHKFKLHCEWAREAESQINNCISYAMSNNVKEFDIKVWGNFFLPQTFFTSSSFVHLRVSKYDFYNCDTGVISWKNLRTLRLKRVELDHGFIEDMLSGSPLLETLELADCMGLYQLDITSKSVKNLVLSFGFEDNGCLSSFAVDAPYISVLTIQKYSTLEELLLLDVSSVIEAELNYFNPPYVKLDDDEPDDDEPDDDEPDDDEPDDDEPVEPFEEMLRGLILSLGHVKEIKIGKLCFEALSLLKAKGFIYPSNLKILEDIDSN